MSTTYVNTVPNPNDPPNQDVQNMQNNAMAIFNIWAKDHYSFNTSTPGLHAQVTFAGNNVPSVPTSPPVLFTNIQDGAGNSLPGAIPQQFFYSGTAAQGQNNYVSKPTGSTFLMGGIILQWGIFTNVASGTVMSFASPFPNNRFSVITANNNGYFGTTNVGFATTVKFNIFSSNGANVSGYYIAIGN